MKASWKAKFFEKTSILEANVEASWHPNRSQIRSYLEKGRKRTDTIKPMRFLLIFEVRGLRFRSQNRKKDDEKSMPKEVRLRKHILIDFRWIFNGKNVDFWWIFYILGWKVGREGGRCETYRMPGSI